MITAPAHHPEANLNAVSAQIVLVVNAGNEFPLARGVHDAFRRVGLERERNRSLFESGPAVGAAPDPHEVVDATEAGFSQVPLRPGFRVRARVRSVAPLAATPWSDGDVVLE